MITLALLATLAQAAPFEAAPPPRYGDQGTSHFGFALGLGTGSGGFRWAGGLDYGYFVVDRVAPGVQTSVSGGTDVLTTGLALGTLRVVPVRTETLAIFLVGRAGRVMLSDHADGWGAGGGGGVVFFMSRHIGLQVAYDYLRLLPSTFCDDLTSGCGLGGLALGIVAAF